MRCPRCCEAQLLASFDRAYVGRCCSGIAATTQAAAAASLSRKHLTSVRRITGTDD
jgi:hypothetical protein